ncbi:MAG: DUF3334 family protein [Alteromonadaceae bacterium]|nr:DUF3334 family protein [Alteromonadaceae bacterium]
MGKKNKVITTEDILITLCQSFTEVLSKATHNKIQYSAMVQKISRTCLRPDIGCFVLFDGGFNGVVVTNFTGAAALEIYHDYLRSMGMPESELSQSFLSDDVSNVMGELMNQIVGDFTLKVRQRLQTSITQSQPKMLNISRLVQISIDTLMDRPQLRRVTFTTSRNNIFYLELAVEKTEFIKLHDFDVPEEVDPDAIMEEALREKSENSQQAAPSDDGVADEDFLADLGL